MTTLRFAFCAIYPVIRKELDEAEEVIVWPPEDDEARSSDSIAEARELIDAAPAVARVFVAQAPDNRAAVNCLQSYFAQHDTVPHSLELLDVEVQSHLLEPFQDRPRSEISCYYLPVLFLMRSLDAASVEELLNCCRKIVSEDSDSD